MESIPQECGFLFERLSKSRPELSLWMPDQLTVNKYEPGQGMNIFLFQHSGPKRQIFESSTVKISEMQ